MGFLLGGNRGQIKERNEECIKQILLINKSFMETFPEKGIIRAGSTTGSAKRIREW